jgi:hypothetical protein
MPLDLDPIRQRHEAATSGTWYLQPNYGPDFVAAEIAGYEHGIGTLNFGDGDQADADRDFVLNAHTDMSQLIAEVEQLRAQLAEYDALQLGHPDGRLSAACPTGEHPTWLRRPDDPRSCPWCALAATDGSAR